MYFVSFGGLIGANGLIEHEFEMAAFRHTVRADRDLARLAVRVAGLEVPVLSFALVRRQRKRVAIGAMECFVAIEQRLHGVRAGFDVRDLVDGIALRVRIDGDAVAAFPVFDIHAEHDLRLRRQIDLVARFVLVVVGEQQHQAALLRALPSPPASFALNGESAAFAIEQKSQARAGQIVRHIASSSPHSPRPMVTQLRWLVAPYLSRRRG